MGNIIELGFLVEPKQVRLIPDGPIYRLPPDVPVPLMLRLEHHADGEVTAEFVQDLYDEILELFRVYQPDLDRLPIGLTQLLTFVRTVYAAEEPEPDPPAPPKRAAGTASTKKPARRPQSRSSS
jgi:hypothetical protein